jgi:hypothetical protein
MGAPFYSRCLRIGWDAMQPVQESQVRQRIQSDEDIVQFLPY